MARVRKTARLLRHQAPPSLDFDELVSIGFLALIEAADRFQERAGCQFWTYAQHVVTGRMRDAIRAVCGRRGKAAPALVTLESFRCRNGEMLLEAASSQGRIEEEIATDQTAALLEIAISELDTRLAEIVRLSFFEGLCLSDIAVRHGLSESRISQLRGQAVLLLRQKLSGKKTKSAIR